LSYHDEETNILQKTVDRSVKQQLARDTTRKEAQCKTPRGRKYTRRNASIVATLLWRKTSEFTLKKTQKIIKKPRHTKCLKQVKTKL